MKKILFDEDLRKKILKGVETIEKAVATTLGPCGKFVAIPGYSTPIITKDGVSVAKEVELKDPFENIGAQTMREISARTNDIAGDGTTTSTVLGSELVKEGYKVLSNGYQPIDIKRGMDKAAKIVIDYIKSASKKVEKDQLKAVATISANNDEVIGHLIAEAFEKVGVDGVANVEETKGKETFLTITEGITFSEGWISSYFINNKDRAEVDYEDALILITDKKINMSEDIMNYLNHSAQVNKPLLIICEELGLNSDALNTIVINDLNGTLRAVAVKAPSYGSKKAELLEDIAMMCGATVISEETGVQLKDCGPEFLGSAKSIKVKKGETTIVGGNGNKEAIAKHISNLKNQLETLTSSADKENMEKRIARFSDSAATITVSAETKTEAGEIKYRVEDAVAATRASLEEGIVEGGGITLLNAAKELGAKLSVFEGDEVVGAKIFMKALEKPLYYIASNAGYSGEVVLNKCKEDFGFNAKTGEYVKDMIKEGVIDPTKVTVACVANANSVAGVLLTTDCAIVKEEDKE